ncbi:hypothetical protein Tco_0248364 [Tanacetum coccineum]
MKHYLAHTDYPIWEVIQNGNGPVSITTDTQGQIKVLPPRTTEEIVARERERKARTTLLMALPEDHLAKFHKMTDAKEMSRLDQATQKRKRILLSCSCHSFGSDTETQPSESETQISEFDTCESNISTETHELVSQPVVNESNVVCQPKVWSDAPIIEEYESDSKDEYVSIPTKEQETPSFANQQVKTPRETVKESNSH